jgi:hypothetical protein
MVIKIYNEGNNNKLFSIGSELKFDLVVKKSISDILNYDSEIEVFNSNSDEATKKLKEK